MGVVAERSEAIRKARNFSFVLFLAFPLVGFGSAFVLQSLGVDTRYVLVILIPYLVVFFFFGIRWSYAQCPMCHAPMYHKYFFFYGFLRCVNCGYNLKDPKSSRVAGQFGET